MLADEEEEESGDESEAEEQPGQARQDQVTS